MKIDAFKSWFKRYETALALTLAVIFSILIIYFGRDNLRHGGMWLSFNELIQAIGQFATVGAFVVGFYQLRKGEQRAIEQTEKERQLIFFNEAKIQIEKMCKEIRLDRREGRGTPLKKLCNLVDVLANLGTNQLQIYDSMKPGPEKEIIDIYWQDMFWNDLAPVLAEHRIFDFLSHADEDMKGYARHYAELQDKKNNYLPVYKDYFFARNVLEILHHYIDASDKDAIEDSASSFELVRLYYFDPAYTKRYLSRIVTDTNMRSHAPVLAALYQRFVSPRQFDDDE